MKKRLSVVTAASLFLIIIVSPFSSFAAHPLITDDTGTQGKGKFQLEINGEYGHESEDGITTKTTQAATTLTYGIIDNLDAVLGIPYQHTRIKDSGAVDSHDGLSDISLELKWRFLEQDGFSFALKPGITLPTGDDDRGLGAGRAGYSVYFITTKEIKLWALHLNLGYKGNDNKVDERTGIWHASLAAEVEAVEKLKLVANIGIEKNPDKASNIDPAFILGGIIYSITDSFEMDLGIKGGLNKPETDYTFLAGITLRF